MKKLPFFLVLMTTFLSSGLLTKVNNDNTLINNQVVQKKAINTNVLETSFNETTKHDTNVLSPVFINTFIDSLDSLINYSNDESIRPSNVILRLNSVLMLVDENGKLLSFLVARKRFFSWFFSKNEVEIRWEQIERVGSDVILVKD